jgi:hypothetical protein
MFSIFSRSAFSRQGSPWLMRFVMGCALTMTLVGCGGGGGSGSEDVDLRAVYDKVQACMTPTDVERLVGMAPSSSGSSGSRTWDSGNQRLFLSAARLDSGAFVVSALQWDLIGGGYLSKGFDIECGGL